MMEIDKNNLHHAYLILGERVKAREQLLLHLTELEIATSGNPDIFVFGDELFGVGEARALTARAREKGFTGRKIFLISPARITPEAQNALLKTFEEPVPNTHFFLVLQEEAQVLPTLLSRMRVVKINSADFERKTTQVFSAENLARARAVALREAFSYQNPPSADLFLGLQVKDRLEFAKKFADEEQDLRVFLDELLGILRSSDGGQTSVRRVYGLRRFALDRTASPRLVLEHLALVL